MTPDEKRILRKAIHTDQLPSVIDPEQTRAEELDYAYYYGTIETGEGVASFHNEKSGNTEIIFFDY